MYGEGEYHKIGPEDAFLDHVSFKNAVTGSVDAQVQADANTTADEAMRARLQVERQHLTTQLDARARQMAEQLLRDHLAASGACPDVDMK